jgi:CMP-2-keto-3-deoxyoctulosonic acid synthetase
MAEVNVVKVVTDERGFALYFPARRYRPDGMALPFSDGFGLQHVGIYACRSFCDVSRRGRRARWNRWSGSEQLRARARAKIFVARVRRRSSR